MPDKDIVSALERAVAAAPDDLHLRLHLASMLLESGRAAEALVQCRTVLERDPQHAKAADLARRAGEAGAGTG